MWFFQRNDVQYRNEWSNYTNWPYKDWLPFPVTDMYYKSHGTANPNPNPPTPNQGPSAPGCYRYLGLNGGVGSTLSTGNIGRYFAVTGIPALGQLKWGPDMLRYPPYFPYVYIQDPSGINPLITGPHNDFNDKYIMKNWSLWCDGKLRENTLDAGVVDNVEKYARASGGVNQGLYFYNFGLNTDPYETQPTGAMNLILFKDIDFEYETIVPPIDLSAQQLTVCIEEDATTPGGSLLGINNPIWNPHQYNYNLYIMEERYNLLTFENGKVWLKFTHHR